MYITIFNRNTYSSRIGQNTKYRIINMATAASMYELTKNLKLQCNIVNIILPFNKIKVMS